MHPTAAPPDLSVAQPARTWRWDVFCRVVDNYGDLGVCRRLALNLAALGQCVRLWVDDADLMQRMAPDMAAADDGHQARDEPPAVGVSWVHWRPGHDTDCAHRPGDVVIEAFGCDPPQAFLEQMRPHAGPTATAAPVWINLEYLSAQAYVERSHGLPSPQLSGPGRGLTKWFYYPGFTERTGGLLREGGLLERRRRFDARAWLQGLGAGAQRQGERRVSLFAYPNAPLEALMGSLAHTAQVDGTPVHLMLTHGPLQDRARQWLKAHPDATPALCLTELPWLSSEDYDHLLWSCDLNFVRGEDSLVRALWAGVPYVWQLYPQEDGAHAAKLQAFWDVVVTPQEHGWPGAVLHWWRAWNGLAPWPMADSFPWPSQPAWQKASVDTRDRLAAQPPLAETLLRFVAQRSAPG